MQEDPKHKVSLHSRDIGAALIPVMNCGMLQNEGWLERPRGLFSSLRFLRWLDQSGTLRREWDGERGLEMP